MSKSPGAVRRFRAERMRENIEVFDFRLSDEEMARIAALDTGDRRRTPSESALGQDRLDLLRGLPGSILAADPLGEVLYPAVDVRVLDDGTDRRRETLARELPTRQRRRPGTDALNRRAPEVLVALKRTNDGGPPGD